MPCVATCKDICSIEETDTEAGAVKYQISFPSSFEFLKSWETVVSLSQAIGVKPLGGLYGTTFSIGTGLVVESLAGGL